MFCPLLRRDLDRSTWRHSRCVSRGVKVTIFGYMGRDGRLQIRRCSLARWQSHIYINARLRLPPCSSTATSASGALAGSRPHPHELHLSAWTPPLCIVGAVSPSHLDKWCRIISLGVLVAPEGLDFQHPSSSSRGYSLLLLHVQYNLPHFSHHTLHQVEPGLSAQPKRLHYSNILIEHLIRNTSPPRRHLKQC